MIIPKENFQLNATAYRFQGEDYEDVPISFFWLFTPPGAGPGLHIHPYQEIFILQQGHVTFTVGDATLEATGGQTVIVPAKTPHKYKNSGQEPLQMVSIHPSKRVIQEWLEE